MYIFKKRQRFGNWEVVDPQREYIQEPSGRKKAIILCYDSNYNELRYVYVDNLISGASKGAQSPGNRGWSTKNKDKHLDTYICYFPNPKSKKQYRVVKKVEGTNHVVTIGYFHKLKEAKRIAETLRR